MEMDGTSAILKAQARNLHHAQHLPFVDPPLLQDGEGVGRSGIRWDPDRGDNLVIFEKSLMG